MTQTPRTENFERLLDQCYPSGFDQATRTWHSWPEYARTLELETIELKRQLAEAQRVTKDDLRRVAEAAVYETEYDGQMLTICGCCGNNLSMNGDKHEPDCVRQKVLSAAIDAAIKEQKK